MADGGGGTILRPEALNKLLAVGAAPGAAMLVTEKGSLLCSAGGVGSSELAASVTANVYSTYIQGGETLGLGKPRVIFVDCNEGRIATVQVLPGLLLIMMCDRAQALRELEAQVMALRDRLVLHLDQVVLDGVAVADAP
mmetsp:Transcript_7640/g.18461  ORF Transcript_7640/g.18461 Transcript_7640/m.18461 type:complete len:139 (+) Transcript_7640:235-651(+)